MWCRIDKSHWGEPACMVMCNKNILYSFIFPCVKNKMPRQQQGLDEPQQLVNKLRIQERTCKPCGRYVCKYVNWCQKHIFCVLIHTCTCTGAGKHVDKPICKHGPAHICGLACTLRWWGQQMQCLKSLQILVPKRSLFTLGFLRAKELKTSTFKWPWPDSCEQLHEIKHCCTSLQMFTGRSHPDMCPCHV